MALAVIEEGVGTDGDTSDASALLEVLRFGVKISFHIVTDVPAPTAARPRSEIEIVEAGR